MSVLKYTMLTLCLAYAGPALAQNTTQERSNTNEATGQSGQVGQYGRTGAAGQEGAAGQSKELDTFIATCLLLGNEEEVALAKFATEKAEDSKVKQFAKMMVEDHQKAIQELQKHAKQGISLNNGNSSKRNNVSQAVSAQSNSAGMDQILQMNQQVAQECLSMTKSELQQKQGKEFDKAYMGSQIGAHIGMLAKLKASEQHVSPEMASMLQKSSQTVKSHLEHAKKICKEMDDSSLRQASN